MPKPTAGIDGIIDALETVIAYLRVQGEGTNAVDLDGLLARVRTEARPDLVDPDEDSEKWSSVPTRRDKP
jgi:hypothetical protein